ncbi:hypothetical protein PMY56_13555 [Clostridium tertium]|uniref:hypothetical protein n=1 Tax=Clostridium tertium TaxID=1559 RepID=UPI00232CC490|nr:hypothetical protein [Clostridium tertium]MDB1924076.1 hypothetical protein [Clostridium tertium]MDB1927163.1 hypothetical protein [Clostridium tertium]MDB1930940.1 hypothetical protein [Clostridium tertium]
MEFITIEQFKEQPKEVQKVFLDWWKPSNGDIYLDVYKNNNVIECCHHIKFMNNEDVEHMKVDNDAIPLFTEGQLRKFIEDKTNGKVESYYAWDYYTIAIRNTGCGGDDQQCDTEETNLLQAYWKVACMIAKEGLNG